MKAMLPTLTIDGYVTNKNIMMRKLWGYFLTSEYSQSNTFYSRICSFKWLLATKDVETDLAKAIEDNLNYLYGKYFDSVVTQVTILDISNTGMCKLKIQLKATDDGKQYDLSQELEYSNTGNIANYEQMLDQLYESYADQDLYI